MKYTRVLFCVCLLQLLIACQNNSKQIALRPNQDSSSIDLHNEHTSQNALDWAGVYQDTIPCADCPGILTTVRLFEDGSFSYMAKYLERNTSIQDTGRIMWHNHGSVIHLMGQEIDSKYKVGENVLLHADSNGNEIQSEMKNLFKLRKVE